MYVGGMKTAAKVIVKWLSSLSEINGGVVSYAMQYVSKTRVVTFAEPSSQSTLRHIMPATSATFPFPNTSKPAWQNLSDLSIAKDEIQRVLLVVDAYATQYRRPHHGKCDCWRNIPLHISPQCHDWSSDRGFTCWGYESMGSVPQAFTLSHFLATIKRNNPTVPRFASNGTTWFSTSTWTPPLFLVPEGSQGRSHPPMPRHTTRPHLLPDNLKSYKSFLWWRQI